jgi:RNA polymerase sigma-70 factor (ECF subfamily)
MSDFPIGTGFVESTVLYAQCSGDDLALQAIAYQILWTYLYRISLHLVRDQEDADALAQDCAQDALVQVHTRLAECREPKAFRSWAKRIVTNLCIDELRRRNRRQVVYALPEESHGDEGVTFAESPEAVVIDWENVNSIRQALRQAPISERSHRAVVGRYLDNLLDEELAKLESERSGQTLLPSHLQVTRAKNLSKLRSWENLSRYLE